MNHAFQIGKNVKNSINNESDDNNDDDFVKFIIYVIFAILFVIGANILSYIILHHCTYNLLIISAKCLWIGTDLSMLFMLLGLFFSSVSGLMMLSLIPTFLSCYWLTLYVIIRIFCSAFNYNYMNYNFTLYQWFAIWLVCQVVEHICNAGSTSSDDSSHDNDSNDSNSSNTSNNSKDYSESPNYYNEQE